MRAAHPTTDSPWLGPESFTEDEADRFFGRTREIRRLVRWVEDGYLTVLFGDSGLGKTSLIRAGLFPELRKRHHTPVYLRLRFDAEAPELIEQVWRQIDEFAPVRGKDGRRPGSLWEWFHDCEQGFLAGDFKGTSIVLVFDQFEELFTKGSEGSRREETRGFLEQLAALAENIVPESIREILESQGRGRKEASKREEVRRRFFSGADCSFPPYRVLLCLRADYLYLFDRLAGMMKSGMKRRMELLPMAREEALEAIRKPAPELIREEVADLLVMRLAKETDDDASIDLLQRGERTVLIQPAVLSLVCDRLNRERIEAGRDRIVSDQIDEKFDSIFLSYYREAFQSLPERVREYVEDHFIDHGGHRVLLSREAVEADIGVAALDALIESRLIQGDERGGIKYVELVHDRFAAVAELQRRARREDAEKAAKQAREDEEARAKRALAEREALIEAEKAEEARRLREAHEAEMKAVEESLLTSKAELEQSNLAVRRLQSMARRAGVALLVLSLISVGGLAVVLYLGNEEVKQANRDKEEIFKTSQSLVEQNQLLTDQQAAGRKEIEQRMKELESLKANEEQGKQKLADLDKQVNSLRDQKLAVENELNRLKATEADRDRLLTETKELKSRLAAMEAVVKAGANIPTKEVVDTVSLSDRERIARETVIAFIEAAGEVGEREQWDFFGDSGFFSDPKAKLNRDEIRQKILDYRSTLEAFSYWMMAPPWVENHSGNSVELGALYGFTTVKEGVKSGGASLARLKLVFDNEGSAWVESFVPERSTTNDRLKEPERFLTDLERFDRLFKIRSELSFSKQMPEKERDRWLAVMTRELYVLAGQSYEGQPANAITPEAGAKLRDQSEFLAKEVDYFGIGVISRLEASRKLAEYESLWPIRTLATVDAPTVEWIPTEGVWLVDAQLRSTTQKKESTAQKKKEIPRVLEVRSEMKIKIDPDEGPVIVWIRGEEIKEN
jgi:hypothetical protein